jgi:hypothetical protein
MAHRNGFKSNTGFQVAELAVDFASINANTSLTTVLTVYGAKAGHIYLIAIDDDDLAAGLMLQGTAWCETDGQIPVRLINTTAAPVDPAAVMVHILGL